SQPAQTPPSSTKTRNRDLSKLALGIVALVFLNLLAQQFFFRIDLTEEQRYSISAATKALLRNLDQDVAVTVYLEGDGLPPDFRRLQRSVRETLDEFQVYADGRLTYRFVNPLTATSAEQREEFIAKLARAGIQPNRVFAEEDGRRIQKRVLPGAIVAADSNQTAAMLLNGDRAAGAREALNQSIENVEYELASAIRRVVARERQRIAFVKGHDELPPLDVAGLTQAVSQTYDLYELDLPSKDVIPPYAALIVAQPQEAFSKQDQYKLDQYIIRGGRVLFFIDPLRVDMDSIGQNGSFAFPLDLGLEDMLFRYGVRINPTLVQDIKSGVYPIVVGEVGGQPQIVPLPWPFFPTVNRYGKHPIVRNLDATYLRFVSSIDTVRTTGVTKTPLVFTSQYSRVLQTPIVVDLNELREEPNPAQYRSGPQAVAYLLEGSFTSVFKNRVLPDGVDKASFQERSAPTKLIVCSDGDLVRNEVNRQNNQPYPLGFDPITERTFANEDFVMNALAYLTDEDGLISARTKDIRVRPLDKVKVAQEATTWQLVNLVVPILLIVAFGVGKHYLRKRKYARF
ncbi:MAG: gliding motility-associated ABC transporter substrate-binding protein GldG, partial [Tunicatimonas sp.]